nr:chymotrypsin-2-like [Onthophagus taurus]
MGNRITNGTEALMNSYPFMASVIFHGGHKCGGSIISNDWILTAAHCCFYEGKEVGDNLIQISVGNVYWRDGTLYRVNKKFVHEAYDPNNVINDIALFKTLKTIKYGLSVSAIPLNQNNIAKNQEAIVIGWGSYMNTNGELIYEPSNKLQHVVIKVVALKMCEKYYGTMSSKNLCGFGGNSKGSCQGDSGGPLIVKNENKMTLIGIVSYGSDCSNTIPEVYTNVNYYYSWIKKVIRQERLKIN